MKMMLDFRSDTLTRPTPAMLEAMFRTQVGDDVFGEDIAINTLEAQTADFFGMEAALFCPSGTMTNQIGINVHTRPGDDVICEKKSHVYIYEGGGIALNSGCQVQAIEGNAGRIYADQIRPLINPDDVHRTRTRVVSLENTCNRGGGTCYELSDIAAVRELCNEHHLALHLDGARIWNALEAKKQDPKEYGRLFDTISVCFSKGLGAPVGSVLLGNKTLIKQARRVRKVMGGGMRQAGYLAAACSFALENHRDRLNEDHRLAAEIGSVLMQADFVDRLTPPETNILIFSVKKGLSPKAICAEWQQAGVLAYAISDTDIRLVTHLDIDRAQIPAFLDYLKTYSPAS
jgi:threonine aldolase